MAFNMQDIVLEPYGGEILGLTVGATTALTALMAGGALARLRAGGALARPRRRPLPRGRGRRAARACRRSAAVIFAAPLESPTLFRAGAALIGFGGGLFAVGTLTAAMSLERAEQRPGARRLGRGAGDRRGAVGGRRRRGARHRRPAWPRRALLGAALTSAVTGYSVVYHIEIVLLFATLVAIGPLVRATARPGRSGPAAFRSGRVSRLDPVVRKENPMGTGAITQYVDVAQLVLYAFWIFFAGLIYYLRAREPSRGLPDGDRRRPRRHHRLADPRRRRPSSWRMAARRSVPNLTPSPQTLKAEPAHAWAGAPLVPTGDNPMLDGVGPGAWADRADVPDMDFEGQLKIVPLRVATDFQVSAKDADPRGLPVDRRRRRGRRHGGRPVGRQAESLFRYLEVETAGGGRRVLLPINFARIRKDRVVRARHPRRSSSPPCRARAAPTR